MVTNDTPLPAAVRARDEVCLPQMVAQRCAQLENEAKADTRNCTCFPGERPEPCERKFASRDCWRSAVLKETQANIVALKNRDRQPHEQILLDYLMRVRTALEN